MALCYCLYLFFMRKCRCRSQPFLAPCHSEFFLLSHLLSQWWMRQSSAIKEIDHQKSVPSKDLLQKPTLVLMFGSARTIHLLSVLEPEDITLAFFFFFHFIFILADICSLLTRQQACQLYDLILKMEPIENRKIV